MADIIHVGLHKTGSTFLQQEIWPQVEGVHYLTRPFTQHNHAFNKLQYADDSVYDREDAAAVLRGFEADRFLISDEALSGKPVMLSCLNRTQTARRLHELFPKAVIVLFVRDQRDIMLSHYNSYVKMPFGVKPIHKLFWKPGADYAYEEGVREGDYYDPETLYYNTNDIFIHFDCFLYAPLVSLYQRLFERVEVFLYEDLKHRQDDVLRRLSAIVNHPLSDISERRTRNPSHSRNELVIRRALNRGRGLVNSNLLVAGVSRVLGSVLPGGSKAAWREQIEKLVGDYYSVDNRNLKTMCPEINWNAYPDKYI